MQTTMDFQPLAIPETFFGLEDGDLSDPILDEMGMTDLEEGLGLEDRRQFMLGCRFSFIQWRHELIGREEYRELLRVNFHDWKTLAAILVQTGCLGFSPELGLGYDIINYSAFPPGCLGFSPELSLGYDFINFSAFPRYFHFRGTFNTEEDTEGCLGCWKYSTLAGHDRIRTLKIEIIAPPLPELELPTSIRRLDYLTELTLGLRSRETSLVLPLEALCSLPRLEVLSLLPGGSFVISERERNWKEKGFKFPHLNQLQIKASLPFNLLEMCPSLRRLDVSLREKTELYDRYVKILSSFDCESAETLETLTIFHNAEDDGIEYGLEGYQMKTLLFQVVPRLPNLRKLRFSPPNNLKVVAQILRSNDLETKNPSRSLQFVGFFFQGNSGIEICNDTEEAMLTFLKTFNTVVDMVFERKMAFLDRATPRSIPSTWEYALIQNMAGRKLLEDDGVRGGLNSLPLSIWPTLLQRIQRRIDGKGALEYWAEKLISTESKTSAKATGIYYLLREGFALTGYKGLVDSPRRMCGKRKRKESESVSTTKRS